MRRADCYYEDGSPKCCAECGSTAFNEKVRSSLDVGVGGGGILLEVETVCKSCGASIAYWAHGYYDPSYMTDKENQP